MITDFNKASCTYWSDVTKASYLQRQIIVHSIIYYQMSENVILDSQFDAIGKQLVLLRKRMGESEYCKTQYYYCFKEFDASTGFYLWDALNDGDKKYLKLIAGFVLKTYKRGGAKC